MRFASSLKRFASIHATSRRVRRWPRSKGASARYDEATQANRPHISATGAVTTAAVTAAALVEACPLLGDPARRVERRRRSRGASRETGSPRTADHAAARGTGGPDPAGPGSVLVAPPGHAYDMAPHPGVRQSPGHARTRHPAEAAG